LFCEQELSSVLGGRKIVQINHSCTAVAGVVRGLHFQNAPHAEMKLVRCLKGKVWDVAVDLRPQSRSYKRWYAQEISPQNAHMMVIPEGFAHGFQVLEAGSELLYLHTAFYKPESEGGVSSGTVTRTATVPVEQFTQYVYVRVRGRQMSFRVDGNQLGLQWQLGAPRIDIKPDGRRGA
jgi:dTDP-4-dehydrorhamnose 3,5-epimerase